MSASSVPIIDVCPAPAHMSHMQGYHGSNQTEAHLLSEAERIGFPVLIKAGKQVKILYIT